MSAPNNPYYQVGLDVLGKRCLVVGGGEEAQDKSGRLVEAGARVVLFSPEVTGSLAGAAARGDLTWERRAVDVDRDLDDTFLVMNTLRDERADALFEACRTRRILINTYDDPDRSDFGMAALVSRGHLRISISSSNASPTLSGALRRQLEAALDDEFVEFLEALATVRRALRTAVTDGPDRRARLRALVEGFELRTELTLPERWRERLAETARTAGLDPRELGLPPPAPGSPDR